jgi:sulfotransferase
VFSRAEGLANGNGLIGSAFNALKEAFYGDETSNLMVLRYETLVSDPARAIAALYAFIEEPMYPHDFDSINFRTDEFDQRLGTPGLHTVHRKVAIRKRTSVLPPDLFRRFENDAFWLDPDRNPRQVKVV